MAHPSFNIPTTIIILGATGDLSQKKLIPALLDLFAKGYLPDVFRVVGFARRSFTDDAFRDFLRTAIEKNTRVHPDALIDEFLQRVSYQSGLFDKVSDYTLLKEHLSALDSNLGLCANKLIYLAVPPEHYSKIFENIASSSISNLCGGEGVWTRVLVEKPFGKDLETARSLDAKLGALFREEQIFRIDHYLAKEALQNVLMFRFSNSLFEPMWNNDHIERVEISLHEAGGVGARGALYDGVGALRDIGQNHLLQMLALVAMEHPGAVTADAIRFARAAVFKKLRRVSGNGGAMHMRRGQYEGYRTEANVAADSQTETYFCLMAHIDSPRWKGVPFYLHSGKKLAEDKVEISIHFKETQSCLCPNTMGAEHHHRNVLAFRIQPDEGISVRFWAKVPGFDLELEPKTLSFSYNVHGGKFSEPPDAYERVLYDCIRGDQTLFASTEEILAEWEFITPILDAWRSHPLESYRVGSQGLSCQNHAA
ncbi:MAG: glucose-6-phosphate dehydrogenase [Candidatus Vogelbacteria bacterium]|nr:glucose-6-phosphate dehydrogenase [Candidatus Vogelbacteria bacterium]